MIGVVVRGDDARDRPTCEQALPQLTPAPAGPVVGQAAVDYGPPVVLLEEPDVDVIQGERQRKSDAVKPSYDRAWLLMEQGPAFI